MMAKSSVMWNPIIYLGRHRHFQQVFLDDLAKFRSYFSKLRNAAQASGETGSNKVVSVAPSSRITAVYEYETCV